MIWEIFETPCHRFYRTLKYAVLTSSFLSEVLIASRFKLVFSHRIFHFDQSEVQLILDPSFSWSSRRILIFGGFVSFLGRNCPHLLLWVVGISLALKRFEGSLWKQFLGFYHLLFRYGCHSLEPNSFLSLRCYTWSAQHFLVRFAFLVRAEIQNPYLLHRNSPLFLRCSKWNPLCQ